VVHHRCRDINDASSTLLSQHVFDGQLGDEEKAFDIDR
jgi:hypothetical protein